MAAAWADSSHFRHNAIGSGGASRSSSPASAYSRRMAARSAWEIRAGSAGRSITLTVSGGSRRGTMRPTASNPEHQHPRTTGSDPATARGEPRAMADETVFKPGLEGVVAFETDIAEPDKEGSALRYRGVDIEDLVRRFSNGNVWGLLVDGGFAPGLPPAEPFPVPVHSGDIRVDVQSALATLAPAWGLEQLLDIDDEQARDDLARCSVTAMSFVAQSARGLGQPMVPQKRIDECETVVERFMVRWRGEPDPAHVKAVDAYFVSAAEHGMNASTFTARVIASTGADVAACLSGAIGAMSGPLHGGAPARVLPMIEEVERIGDARKVVTGILDSKQRLMGFGHRVYRAEDPRARVLRRTAKELGSRRFDAAEALEQAALAELRERRPDRPIETNVEFWAAVILDFAEVPPHMMPAMFTCARTAGWSAHIMEQKKTGRLVRPSARYIGPAPRKPEEVEGWSDIAHA